MLLDLGHRLLLVENMQTRAKHGKPLCNCIRSATGLCACLSYLTDNCTQNFTRIRYFSILESQPIAGMSVHLSSESNKRFD